MADRQGSGAGSLQRLVFLLSAVVLSVVYGVLSTEAGWFPSGLLERALRQARLVTSPPDFAHPRVYRRSGARAARPGAASDGMVLVSSRWEDLGWEPALRLIDREGEVLHTWPVPMDGAEEGPAAARTVLDERGVRHQTVHGVELLEGGDVVFNLPYVRTLRMDACGEVEWELPVGGHHTVERAPDGSFWVPSIRPEPSVATPDHPEGLPGFGQPVFQERLLRVSPDGRILDSINLLDLMFEGDLGRYLFRGLSYDADLTHLNDVEPLPDSLAEEHPLFASGDLLVSLRNQHLVFVVDPDTREIRWHETRPFVYQHDPDFLADGWIGVFDNRRDRTERGDALGGSRIVALQPHTDSTGVLFPTERSEPFYTAEMGKWQQLAVGNRLLVESEAGRIVEVDPEGRTVWEWIHRPYESTHVPEVTEAMHVDLGPEEIESWPCAGPR